MKRLFEKERDGNEECGNSDMQNEEKERMKTYFKYGRVMFFRRVGYRSTKAFHSSLLILPSMSASASANVCKRNMPSVRMRLFAKVRRK